MYRLIFCILWVTKRFVLIKLFIYIRPVSPLLDQKQPEKSTSSLRMSFRRPKVVTADPIDEYRKNTRTDEMESHPPIPTKVFNEHLRYMATNDNQLLVTEFSTIPMSPDYPRDISEVSYNMEKNRYDNILPYNHSRVNLSCVKGIEGSDYINGSHLDVSA